MTWTTALGLVGLGIVELLRDPGALSACWPTLIFLLLPTIVASHIASDEALAGTSRVSMTFLLAAMVLLPPSGLVLLTLAAAAAGRGGGVAGPYRRGLVSVCGIGLAVLVAEMSTLTDGWPASLTAGEVPWRLGLLFLIVQAAAFLVSAGLSEGRAPVAGRIDLATVRAVVVETLNVPLAWLLAIHLQEAAWLPAGAMTVLVLMVLAVLARLDRALREVREAHGALSSRCTELATLNAIGTEIVSSMDPDRVFEILDRECKAIFEADSCFITLADDEGALRLVYRRIGDDDAETFERSLPSGLSTAVFHGKRGRRIDDLEQLSIHSLLRKSLVPPDSRSLLAAPLILEDRVIGVISVQSRRPRAYDHHQLSVLATIAQQAAVAIEHARQFRMATVDSLTGFFVRDYFFSRLAEEDRRARRYGGRFSLLMVDLDEFKTINDRFGHLAGDDYLAGVTSAIREQLRGADLACRYGGDEFCVLLPETDVQGARAIAERIREAVAALTVTTDGPPLRSTVSIGLASYPEHDPGDLEGLVRSADDALYRAKRGGRDRVVPHAA